MSPRQTLTGTCVLLGTEQSPHECLIQTPGAGLQILADDHRRAVVASATLHQHLLRFVQAAMVQMGQTALSNAAMS